MASTESTVVEHLPPYPKVEGSSISVLAAGTAREREKEWLKTFLDIEWILTKVLA
jgi:hypothetical protein